MRSVQRERAVLDRLTIVPLRTARAVGTGLPRNGLKKWITQKGVFRRQARPGKRLFCAAQRFVRAFCGRNFFFEEKKRSSEKIFAYGPPADRKEKASAPDGGPMRLPRSACAGKGLRAAQLRESLPPFPPPRPGGVAVCRLSPSVPTVYPESCSSKKDRNFSAARENT